MAKPVDVELLVVGGGVAGLSLAVEAARAKQSVLVIDSSGGCGGGASGAAAGVLWPPMGRLARSRPGRLIWASWALLPAWIRSLQWESGVDVGWVCCGGERLVVHAPRQLTPHQGWRDGRWTTTAAGRLEPLAVLDALRHILRQRHAPILSDDATALLVRERMVLGVMTARHGPVYARRTVIAAGSGSAALLAPLGLGRDLAGVAGCLVQLRDVPVPERLIGVHDATLVGKPDGSVWVTSGRVPASLAAAPPPPALDATISSWDLAASVLGVEGRLAEVWSGVRVVTPSQVPYAGPAPGWSGLDLLVGLGKHGYLLAPLLSQLALGAASAALTV